MREKTNTEINQLQRIKKLKDKQKWWHLKVGVHTVVVKNPERSQLCLGLWYQPMRVSSGWAVEHKPYAGILEREGREEKWGDKQQKFYYLGLYIYHPQVEGWVKNKTDEQNWEGRHTPCRSSPTEIINWWRNLYGLKTSLKFMVLQIQTDNLNITGIPSANI